MKQLKLKLPSTLGVIVDVLFVVQFLYSLHKRFNPTKIFSNINEHDL
jgi:hypothetical protein